MRTDLTTSIPVLYTPPTAPGDDDELDILGAHHALEDLTALPGWVTQLHDTLMPAGHQLAWDVDGEYVTTLRRTDRAGNTVLAATLHDGARYTYPTPSWNARMRTALTYGHPNGVTAAEHILNAIAWETIAVACAAAGSDRHATAAATLAVASRAKASNAARTADRTTGATP